MSASFKSIRIAALAAVATGSILASFAPALAFQERDQRHAVVCDYNTRGWNDRFNADDQDPTLAMRYRQSHPACTSR